METVAHSLPLCTPSNYHIIQTSQTLAYLLLTHWKPARFTVDTRNDIELRRGILVPEEPGAMRLN